LRKNIANYITKTELQSELQCKPDLGWALCCFSLGRTACRIFPDQGSNPCPLPWECRVLTTGPPGKSKAKLWTEHSSPFPSTLRLSPMYPAFCLWARKWLSGWTTLNPNQPILVLLEATLTNVQGETPGYCMKTDLGDTVGWLDSFISAGTWSHQRCGTGQKPRHWVTGDLLDNHQGLSPFIMLGYLRKNFLNGLCVCVCLYHCVSASGCSSLCVYLGMCVCLCLPPCIHVSFELSPFLGAICFRSTFHDAKDISWAPSIALLKAVKTQK